MVQGKPVIKYVIFIIFPVFVFFISQMILGLGGGGNVEPLLIPLNILILEALLFLLYGISGNIRVSFFIEAFLIWILSLANNYVRLFRGSFILPLDFLSLQTAKNVAGNYDYTPDSDAVKGTISFIILIIIMFVLYKGEEEKPKAKARTGMIVISLISVILLSILLSNDGTAEMMKIHDSRFFITDYYSKNGLEAGFIRKLSKIAVERPEGYDNGKYLEVIENTKNSDKGINPKELPDIIVVMNETFSDLKEDADFETPKDYMPFFRSMEGREDTVTGHVVVSGLGGNTPNSEFEFLTGFSMAFLPENSIPFQLYLNRDVDALPGYLKSLGYQTLAAHPYLKSGWNREKAWPHLGFEETAFLPEFEESSVDLRLIRDYVSDASQYEWTIEKAEERLDPKKPVFIFDVTMQNHSSYLGTYDNFKPDISVTGVDPDKDGHSRQLINYLSLIHESDSAFEELIEHYENEKRKTLILMFGDHQPEPGVVSPLYALNGKDVNSLEKEDVIRNHTVPFVIWANYDIEEGRDEYMSLNYLGNLLLKEAGIPLSRYRSRLDGYYEDHPVICSLGGQGKDGEILELPELKKELKELASLQYYELFEDEDAYDRRSRSGLTDFMETIRMI